MTTRKLIIYAGVILLSLTTVFAIVANTGEFKADGGGDLLPGTGIDVCADDKPFKTKYEIQINNGHTAGTDSLRSVSLPNYQSYHQVDFRDYLDPKLDVFLSGKTSLNRADVLALQTLIDTTYNEWVSLPAVREKFYMGVEKPPVFASADVVNRFNYTPNVPERKYIGFSNPLKYSSETTTFEIQPRSVDWRRLKEGGHITALNWSAKAEFRTGNAAQRALFDCLELFGNFNGSAKLQYIEARAHLNTKSYKITFFLGYNPSGNQGYGNIFPR